jgi:hypothetical protein
MSWMTMMTQDDPSLEDSSVRPRCLIQDESAQMAKSLELIYKAVTCRLDSFEYKVYIVAQLLSQNKMFIECKMIVDVNRLALE